MLVVLVVVVLVVLVTGVVRPAAGVVVGKVAVVTGVVRLAAVVLVVVVVSGRAAAISYARWVSVFIGTNKV